MKRLEDDGCEASGGHDDHELEHEEGEGVVKRVLGVPNTIQGEHCRSIADEGRRRLAHPTVVQELNWRGNFHDCKIKRRRRKKKLRGKRKRSTMVENTRKKRNVNVNGGILFLCLRDRPLYFYFVDSKGDNDLLGP